MPNIWKHPVIAEPGIMVVDEFVCNNFASFSAAQITAQYSDAELLELYERGVRKIDLRLPFRDVVTDADAGTYTLKAGVADKLEAMDDIVQRWHAFPGTSTIFVLAHLAGVNGYIEAMSDADAFATCIGTIVAEMPLSWADPRVMWAWAVEPSATGKTQAQFGKFNYDLAQSLGSDFTDRCWLAPINRFSLLSDLPTAVIWSTDGTNFSPPSSGLTSGGGNSGPVNIAAGDSYRFGPFTIAQDAGWNIDTTFTASGSGSQFRWQVQDSGFNPLDTGLTSFTAGGPDSNYADVNAPLNDAGVFYIECECFDAGVSLTGVTLTLTAGVTEPAGTSLPSEMNVAARAACYFPFFLTHLNTESDYSAALTDTIPPNYPFTEARRAQMEAHAGGSYTGRLETDADATVGLGFPEIQAEFNKAADFEAKYRIPVIVEECGFSWRTGWGDNGAQIAWVDDVIAAAETFGLRERIGWFSKSPVSPTVVNFALGFTTAVNTVTSISKGVLRSITKGNINVSSGEVSEMYSAERSDAMAWTPSRLGAKLLAWYSAEDVVGANGASIDSWPIRDGSWDTPLTSTGSSRPTVSATTAALNDLRAVSFTATQFMSLSGVSQAMPLAVSMAMDPTINTTAGGDRYTHFFDAPSGTRFAAAALQNSAATTKNYLLVQSGSVWTDYGVTTAESYWQSPQVLTAIFSNTTNQAFTRVNGTVLKTGTHTQATLTTLRVGASSSGGGGLNGQVTDVVVVGGTLTADELLRLEWYIASRAGITLANNKYSGSIILDPR